MVLLPNFGCLRGLFILMIAVAVRRPESKLLKNGTACVHLNTHGGSKRVTFRLVAKLMGQGLLGEPTIFSV